MILRNMIFPLLACKFHDSRIVACNGTPMTDNCYVNAGGYLYQMPDTSIAYDENNTQVPYGQYQGNLRAIVLGSGSTPATIEDYKMENYITPAQLTRSNESISLPDGTFKVVITLTVTNNNAEPITVSEVGTYMQGYTTGYPAILLTRTVLDNPVVLNQGDSKTFTVEVDYQKFIDNISVSI